MDTGDVAIVVTLGIGIIGLLLALFALLWQTRGSLRSEIRELGSQLGKRISDCEREQVRLDERTALEQAKLDEIRELSARLGERISDREREQVRLDERNALEQGKLDELRELSARLGERISDSEREQVRLEGANGSLAEVLKQQSHTHGAAAD